MQYKYPCDAATGKIEAHFALFFFFKGTANCLYIQRINLLVFMIIKSSLEIKEIFNFRS